MRPGWHDLANCGRNGIIGDDPAVRVRRMYPTEGSMAGHALSVCEGCPVAADCLADADLYGTWGGVGQRRRLVPPKPRKPREPKHGTCHSYNLGCRCGQCREASSVYRRGRYESCS